MCADMEWTESGGEKCLGTLSDGKKKKKRPQELAASFLHHFNVLPPRKLLS